MTDDELDILLRSAESRCETPTSFNAAVWGRIGSRKPSLADHLHTLISSFVRPVAATITTVGVIGVSVWLGSNSPRETENGPTAYLEAVSPFIAAKTDLGK